jgi:hypothetical protein
MHAWALSRNCTWDSWKDSGGNAVETCSILTATPNTVTLPVHDRMPVNLDPDAYDFWLDPGMRDAGAASELLKPCDSRLMRCCPVNTQINREPNDDEECCASAEVAQIQHRASAKPVLRSRTSKVSIALETVQVFKRRRASRISS